MSEDCWALASAVEIFGNIFENSAAPEREQHGVIGVVVARPHATGWFLSAHHRPDLDPDEVEHFAEFARVRCYLLLTAGPTAETWTPGPGDDDWLAWSLADQFEVAESVPDAVPADWR